MTVTNLSYILYTLCTPYISAKTTQTSNSVTKQHYNARFYCCLLLLSCTP